MFLTFDPGEISEYSLQFGEKNKPHVNHLIGSSASDETVTRVVEKTRKILSVLDDKKDQKNLRFEVEGTHALIIPISRTRMHFRLLLTSNKAMLENIREYAIFKEARNETSLVVYYFANRVFLHLRKKGVLAFPAVPLSNEKPLRLEKINELPNLLEEIIETDWETPGEIAARIYMVAKELFHKGNVEYAIMALSLLEQSITGPEFKDRVFLLRAFLHYFLTDFDQQLEEINIQLDWRIEDPEACVIKGLILDALLKPIEAVECFKTVLANTSVKRTHQSLMFAVYGLVRSYYRLKNLDLALRYLVMLNQLASYKSSRVKQQFLETLREILRVQTEILSFLIHRSLQGVPDSLNADQYLLKLSLSVIEYSKLLPAEEREVIRKQFLKEFGIFASSYQLMKANTNIVDQIRACIGQHGFSSETMNCLQRLSTEVYQKGLQNIFFFLKDGRPLWFYGAEDNPSDEDVLLANVMSAILSVFEETKGTSPKEMIIPLGDTQYYIRTQGELVIAFEGMFDIEEIKDLANRLLLFVGDTLGSQFSKGWSGELNIEEFPREIVRETIETFLKKQKS